MRNQSNNSKLFVWDFHGTLEKGNDDAIVAISNLILERNGYTERITIKDAELLAGGRWSAYYAYILPHEPSEVHIRLQTESTEFSLKNPHYIAQYVQLNSHAKEVLEAIHHSHHSQILLSNCNAESLDFFLEAVGIDIYFTGENRIPAFIPHQAHITKADLLMNYLSKRSFFDGLVSIGDSPGDVALAGCHPKGIGYLYTHPERTHRESSCHFKINTLKAILQEI